MKFSKLFRLSFNMLLHSKLRSWLTIIGIFIGVLSVVTIISLGQGLQTSVNSELKGFGQDIITITSGSSRALGGGFGGGVASINVKQLSNQDIQTLKLVPGIKSINGAVSGRATVSFQSQNTSLSIQGDDPAVFQDFVSTSLSSGRYLEEGDVNSVVIGDSIANTIFRNKLQVSYILTINNQPFRVIGILSPSTGFASSDNSIYMSTTDARKVLNGTTTLASDEYSSISIKVANANFVSQTSTEIENALINSHHVTKNTEDFTIISAQSLQQSIGTITGFITLFLGLIAAISLIVGGIGVANTMFTSVLEKTRDIGIMKAVGAKNSDILTIFLLNSGMLGFVGGALGIGFSILISLAVPTLGISLGAGSLTIPINPLLLLFAVIFSVLIGMISGAIPAYNASKLKPVDALRYE